MSKKPTTKPVAQERELALSWNIPEDLISGYATNILVQTGEHEFFISFFETSPPIILKPQDIEKLEKVNAECFSRIIVAPDRMQSFIDVLQQQLDAYNNKKAEAKLKTNASK
jgi:hypothetical protein